eukprot:2563710-Prymnesium_polylepis.1
MGSDVTVSKVDAATPLQPRSHAALPRGAPHLDNLLLKLGQLLRERVRLAALTPLRRRCHTNARSHEPSVSRKAACGGMAARQRICSRGGVGGGGGSGCSGGVAATAVAATAVAATVAALAAKAAVAEEPHAPRRLASQSSRQWWKLATTSGLARRAVADWSSCLSRTLPRARGGCGGARGGRKSGCGRGAGRAGQSGGSGENCVAAEAKECALSSRTVHAEAMPALAIRRIAC